MEFKYLPKSEKQLRKNYSDRLRENLNGFADFEDFLSWYNSQEKICHYCKLTEIESQELVMTGLLNSNRFPQNGIIGRGTSRGVWLEVDRLNPKGKYSRTNSVLCCYFCNNDKSDVFDSENYLKFRQNRIEFLREKLKK
jgi:hypothetical protein